MEHRFKNRKIISPDLLVFCMYSLLVSVSFLIGRNVVLDGYSDDFTKVYYFNLLSVKKILLLVLFSMFGGVILKKVFYLFYELQHQSVITLSFVRKYLLRPVKTKHFRIYSFLLLLISWGICWLTFFPGGGMNDTLWILQDPIGKAVQHTFVYDILLIKIVSIGLKIFGRYEYGIALYSFCQMVFCAVSVSTILNWLNNKRVPRIFTLGILIYCVCSRVMSLIVFAGTKDVIFSFSILLLIPIIYECCTTKGQVLLSLNTIFWFCVLFATVILIRNNGFFIVVGVVFCLGVQFRKYWKQILIIFMVGVILPTAIDNYLMRHFVHEEKIVVESLAIPMQQFAAVISNDDGVLTTEQKDVLEKIMPLDYWRDNYNPYSVDSLKWGKNTPMNKNWIASNLEEFLKTWLFILPKNVKIYIEAYLLQTSSYWCFGLPCYGQGLFYDYPSVPETGIEIKKISIFPERIQLFLEDHYRLDEKMDSPSGGTLVWLLILTCIYLCFMRKKDLLICYSPVFFVWGTLMVSAPIAYGFRYVYALYVSCPFLLVVPVLSCKDENLLSNCKLL